MGDFQNGYWSGIWVGIIVGIILGWTLWRLPVHARRYMDKRQTNIENEISRILGLKAAPLRSMQEIAADPVHVPQHLRKEEDTEWPRFRDDPQAWLRAYLPEPRTPTQVAEEKYQEIICTEAQSDGVKLIRSSFGPPEKTLAPWLETTMVITRSRTDVRSHRSSSTSGSFGRTSVAAS